MKKIVKPHKARKPSASTGVPSFARGKDRILKYPARLLRLVINGLGGYDTGKDDHKYYDYIITQSMLGNPTAKRMTGEDDRYIPAFGQGDRSNLVIGSYGNYATPSVMNVGGELMYVPNPWAVFPEWMVQNQSFRFNNPNDAIDFAENYKYSSPAFSEFFGVDNSVNYNKGKDDSLIQNTAEYNQWRSTLPKNLLTETPDYDLYGAFQAGLQPEWNNEDNSYHLGSRDPKTGRILKRPRHPTFGQAIYNDMYLGYYPIYRDGEIYTEQPLRYNKGKDSGIHIKKKNRGKFTALKKRTGKSASWFKEHGTPAQKKMAVFALNARKWKH